MPTVDWLKTAFDYGFDSGDVLSRLPSGRRWLQERRIGGSYRKVFLEAIKPHLRQDSIVLELGPGRGSWSRAILRHIPKGKLYTADFVDTSRWLRPADYEGRVVNHRVQDNSFTCFEDGSFDFFWSFGVMCHQNPADIVDIMRHSRPKMKPGGIAIHQYGDWNKLDAYGWRKGRVPERFKELPDEKIWWPRNNREHMVEAALRTGWTVLREDLGLLERDGMICLRNGE